MQEEKEVVFNRTDLCSRGLASIERQYISDTIRADENIIVNMEKVISLGCGYADELFGILVKEHGLDKVAGKVQLIGSDAVLEQAADAMLWRHNERQNRISNHELQKDLPADASKQIHIPGL